MNNLLLYTLSFFILLISFTLAIWFMLYNQKQNLTLLRAELNRALNNNLNSFPLFLIIKKADIKNNLKIKKAISLRENSFGLGHNLKERINNEAQINEVFYSLLKNQAEDSLINEQLKYLVNKRIAGINVLKEIKHLYNLEILRYNQSIDKKYLSLFRKIFNIETMEKI